MRSVKAAFAVLLHGRQIGTLQRREDYTWLTFDPGYVADPERAVLGLRFEEDLRARHRAQLRLPPWFSNLLPEGQLREWIASARGVPISREMELLAEVGRDLPGAVQVIETNASGEPFADARREILAGAAKVGPANLWRFSLAGVALKFSMLAQGDRFTAPGVGEGGDWIIKLPDPKYPHVPLNELAMMTLAHRVGIDVPDVKLVHREQLEFLPDGVWPRDELEAFAIRRFDRDSARKAIHIEDLAQVRGFYPDDKYRGTFETVASLVYRRRDAPALEEFARRLAFNVLIENGDAHLKNWSLIYRDQRVPTLAPAYDLVATSIYRPSGVPENLGLKFCGSRRFQRVSLACFAALQTKLGARVPLVEHVVQLVERVRMAWPEIVPLFEKQPELGEQIGARIRANALLLTKK